MAGQAVVTINGKQWSVSVANTFTELATGLSGVESIPAATGMLFDLGYDHKHIEVDMSRMLFPLDIIFINSTQGVDGVMQNVQPGLSAILDDTDYPGARYFLEVNAGEAEGIEDWDTVDIQGYTPQVSPLQADIAAMFMVGLLGGIMSNVFQTQWEER